MAVVSPLPSGADGARIELEEVEAALLRSLAEQLRDFVAPESADARTRSWPSSASTPPRRLPTIRRS